MNEVQKRIRAERPVTVSLLADEIGISRNGLYGAIAREEVRAVRIGRAIFVPAREARRLLGMEEAA